MEPQAKKIKLSEHRHFQFSDLNDNCILSILELLPLSDLCSVSFTCKYMQSWAQREYHRRNPNELITIEIKRRSAFKGELRFANEMEKTKKYFGKVFRNIRFFEANTFRVIGVDVDLLYNFMKLNCCESLNSLSIHIISPVNINDKIHPDEYVKKQLESVQSLTIERLEYVPAIWKGIVDYCVNLNTLTIMDDEFPWASTIPLRHLENIQKLTVAKNESEITDMNKFVQEISFKCPNLEVFEMHYSPILSLEELLTSCVLHLLKLKNFELHYNGEYYLHFDPDHMIKLEAIRQSQPNAMTTIHFKILDDDVSHGIKKVLTSPSGMMVFDFNYDEILLESLDDESSSSLAIVYPQLEPQPIFTSDSDSDYADSDHSSEILNATYDEDSDSYSSVYMKEFPSATFSSDADSDSDEFYSY